MTPRTKFCEIAERYDNPTLEHFSRWGDGRLKLLSFCSAGGHININHQRPKRSFIVKRRTGKDNINEEDHLSYEVEESDDSEGGGEGEGGRDSVGTDEAEGEADGRVTHDRRDHQAKEHLDRRVPVNRLILIVY